MVSLCYLNESNDLHKPLVLPLRHLWRDKCLKAVFLERKQRRLAFHIFSMEQKYERI